jgi:molybdopterin-binding protein
VRAPRPGTAVPARRFIDIENRSARRKHRMRAVANYRGAATMKLSARNQIKGKIVDVRKGATTSHVRVDIGNGNVVTSSITNEAVEELGLKAGGNAIVVIKASDVMIAVD